jgi:hypothetical protein
MAGRLKVVVGIGVAGLAGLILYSQDWSSDGWHPYLRRTVAQYQEITVPAGARNCVISDVERPSGFSVRVTWEFRSDLTWQEYREWALPRLLRTFKKGDEKEKKMCFSRQVDGDLHTLTIEPVADSKDGIIRVTFVGIAD